MREYINRGEKVLTYFPYRSQVDQIYNLIDAADHVKMRRYHGQIPTVERKMVEHDYKTGTAMGLFCTKAFGMGIDVGDIKHVIHFAPTGTLSEEQRVTQKFKELRTLTIFQVISDMFAR